VSMLLSRGLRRRLEERFDCPVLDVYSLNEAGPVAVFDSAAAGHVLLQPMLYIEILDSAGHPLNVGERGEITLTGGFNFCLPLLRYRTGDYASLSFEVETPALVGLSGRAPVRFRVANGEWIN
ncbi:MAG: capsule biosynthesis protein CapK, partial [Acidobacteria bacterium]